MCSSILTLFLVILHAGSIKTYHFTKTYIVILADFIVTSTILTLTRLLYLSTEPALFQDPSHTNSYNYPLRSHIGSRWALRRPCHLRGGLVQGLDMSEDEGDEGSV